MSLSLMVAVKRQERHQVHNKKKNEEKHIMIIMGFKEPENKLSKM